MSAPITPNPAVFRTTVNVAKIGTIPKPFAVINVASAFLKSAAVNGDAVFYSDIEQGSTINPQGFYAVRVRPKVFAYAEYSYFPGGQSIGGNLGLDAIGCRQIGPNALQVFAQSTGTYMQFNLPNQADYGHRTALNNVIPATPPICGAGDLVNTFYSPSQGLAAYEFIVPFPDDYFDFASIYAINLNGQQLVNGGFIANVPNSQNAFNQTSLKLPPEVFSGTTSVANQNAQNYSNGWNSYCTIEASTPWNIGAYETVIVQGGLPLQCNESIPNNLTYATTINGFNWTQAQLVAIPNFGLNLSPVTNPGTSYCEVPGIFIVSTYVAFPSNPWNGFIVFTQGVLVQCAIAQNINLENIVIFADGTLIGLNNTGTGWDVYEGTFNLLEWNFYFPSFTFQAQSTLVNYARPISVNGSYLT